MICIYIYIYIYIYLQAELSLVVDRLHTLITILSISYPSQLYCTSYCRIADVSTALSHAALPISICLKS